MSISKSEFLSGLSKFKSKQDAYNDSVYAKKGEIGSAFSYRGSVDSFDDLPENATAGDIYNVKNAGGTDIYGSAINAGDDVIFNGTGWDVLAGTVDLSGYVEKISGKSLSTEDYTTADKEKLTGIATGAEVNVITSIKVNNVEQAITDKTVDIDLSSKVDKVTGKQLSTEDYTTEEKSKLDGIATGAEVNAISIIKVNDTSITPVDKVVNIDLSDYVEKINGKSLSTNDFTDALKTKLENISEESITQADIDALFATDGE